MHNQTVIRKKWRIHQLKRENDLLWDLIDGETLGKVQQKLKEQTHKLESKSTETKNAGHRATLVCQSCM